MESLLRQAENVKPLQYFNHYLKSGYHPFCFEMKELYYSQLEEVFNLISMILKNYLTKKQRSDKTKNDSDKKTRRENYK